MVGTFRGTFSPFDAKLEVAEDGSATLSGSAPVSGVTVQGENLTVHLQGPDFFDAERNPELAFESTRFDVDGSAATVTGNLTIKGTTIPVELTGTLSGPIVDGYGRQRLGLVLETTIDRTAFGILWQNPLPSGEPSLADEVELTAELFLIQQ
jgi:polyisoprenoid-binding protein YceI